MVSIVCVCGMGLGSGLLIRMGVERVLKRNGLAERDFRVEVADISTARASAPQIFVTSVEFAASLRDGPAEVVEVRNLFDESELEPKLMVAYKQVAGPA
ncbi:MAG: PTS sugar transporter subunit IIB [Symbiobacteriia bacterium]